MSSLKVGVSLVVHLVLSARSRTDTPSTGSPHAASRTAWSALLFSIKTVSVLDSAKASLSAMLWRPAVQASAGTRYSDKENVVRQGVLGMISACPSQSTLCLGLRLYSLPSQTTDKPQYRSGAINFFIPKFRTVI